MVLGGTAGINDATTLGLIKVFPKKYIGYYQSGSGFGGIAGSALLLIFKAFGVEDYIIYLIAIPMLVPVFLIFYWITLK